MYSFFYFDSPATTEIYTYVHTLSLHDALPIYGRRAVHHRLGGDAVAQESQRRHDLERRPGRIAGGRRSVLPLRARTTRCGEDPPGLDRKSTRLNSSH